MTTVSATPTDNINPKSTLGKTWRFNAENNFLGAHEPGTALFLKNRYFVFQENGKLSDFGYLKIDKNRSSFTFHNYSGSFGDYHVVKATEKSLSLHGKITIDNLTGPLQLESNLQLNLSNKMARPPVAKTIQDAAMYGDLEAIKSFLKQGTNINSQDEYGMTALAYAAYYYHPQVTNFLLQQKANPNLWAANKKTALFLAIESNNTAAVIALLQHGAKVNVARQDGESPFITALTNGCDLAIIKSLVQYGAKINACNENGWPTLMLAFVGASAYAHEKVRVGDKTRYYDTYPYIPTSKLPIIKYLVERGADVNARAGNNCNIICSAAGYGNYELIKYLLDHGAINKKVGGLNGTYDATSMAEQWCKSSKDTKTTQKIIELIKNSSANQLR